MIHFKTLLTFAVIFLVSPPLHGVYGAACDDCTCYGNTVSCNNLLEMPTDFPASTTQITINNTPMTSIPVAAFSGLSNLYTLTFIDCGIETILSGTFMGLENLHTLYLDDNVISNIEENAFLGLENLQYLYLQYNLLTVISPGMFRGLHSLRYLYLQHNRIGEVQKNSFNGLWSMKELDLSNNLLTTVGESIYSAMITLEYLYLDDNSIHTFHPAALRGLVNLEYLQIFNNEFLTTLPDGLFYGLFSFYFIDADTERFDVIPKCTYLQGSLQPCHYSCWTCNGYGPDSCLACADDKSPIDGNCEHIENSASSAISLSSISVQSVSSFESQFLENPTLSAVYIESSILAYSIRSRLEFISSTQALSSDNNSNPNENKDDGIDNNYIIFGAAGGGLLLLLLIIFAVMRSRRGSGTKAHSETPAYSQTIAMAQNPVYDEVNFGETQYSDVKPRAKQAVGYSEIAIPPKDMDE